MNILIVLNFAVAALVSQSFRCSAFQLESKAATSVTAANGISNRLQAPEPAPTTATRNNIRSIQSIRQQVHNQRPSSIILSSSNSSNNNNSSNSKATTKTKSKGVYSRPSAAIEKGSGFFVPGLEGSKVRIVFGTLVLILNFINHAVTASNMSNYDISSMVGGLAFSEQIATFYGIFLLFQGLIEFAKENGLGFDNVSPGTGAGAVVSNDSSDSNNLSSDNEDIVASEEGLEQFISPALKERSLAIAEAVCWTAASYLSLTSATHVMLLEETGDVNEDGDIDINSNSDGVILYRLGDFQNTVLSSVQVSSDGGDTVLSSSTSTCITAAVQTVYQSRGGRVSIPSSHPGATLLPEENRRCVLLQSVFEHFDDNEKKKKRVCLLVGSDQLLATFTKNDLKWLGSLGSYLRTKLE